MLHYSEKRLKKEEAHRIQRRSLSANEMHRGIVTVRWRSPKGAESERQGAELRGCGSRFVHCFFRLDRLSNPIFLPKRAHTALGGD